jgi:hypothetical protein
MFFQSRSPWLNFNCSRIGRRYQREISMQRQDVKARKLTVFLAALVLGTLVPARFAWAQG